MHTATNQKVPRNITKVCLAQECWTQASTDRPSCLYLPHALPPALLIVNYVKMTGDKHTYNHKNAEKNIQKLLKQYKAKILKRLRNTPEMRI